MSSQDAGILRTVKQYRKAVETRRASLQEARADQARLVAEQAAQKQRSSRRSRSRADLASVKDEIAAMQAEEARRQAALAAQARARRGAAARTAAAQQTATRTCTSRRTTRRRRPNFPAPGYGQVVAIAMQYLGVPYVWGGASPSKGFDCSGFVMYVFAQVGVSLPHHAASQYGYGVPVSRDQLAPGDLVFFSGLGHIGIYIGGGQFVHAPHTGDVVRISSMDERWGSFYGARRLL